MWLLALRYAILLWVLWGFLAGGYPCPGSFRWCRLKSIEHPIGIDYSMYTLVDSLGLLMMHWQAVEALLMVYALWLGHLQGQFGSLLYADSLPVQCEISDLSCFELLFTGFLAIFLGKLCRIFPRNLWVLLCTYLASILWFFMPFTAVMLPKFCRILVSLCHSCQWLSRVLPVVRFYSLALGFQCLCTNKTLPKFF